MENKVVTYDKSRWGKGPWLAEPDRDEFEHAGFPCLALRNNLGAWCGYVAVPPGHPAHGVDYNALDVEVHGGLTYGHQCAGPICHVPKPGEPDNVFWLGFDCAHAMDLVPSLHEMYRRDGIGMIAIASHRDTYRDLVYVKHEIVQLADQLSAIAPAPRRKTRKITLETTS